jgi:hypothetical protein
MDFTPQHVGSTSQNAESTSLKGDKVLPLSTNKWTDSGGDLVSQTIRFVKQEPLDINECDNPVIQSMETTQTQCSQLELSGAKSHPISDTNVGDVKQESPDSDECQRSVSQSDSPTEGTVSHNASRVTSDATNSQSSHIQSSPLTSLSNIVTPVQPTVIQGVPATNTTTQNCVGLGPKPVFLTVVPRVSAAHTPSAVSSTLTGSPTLLPKSQGNAATPCHGVVNPVIIGSQTVLPGTIGNAAIPSPRVVKPIVLGSQTVLTVAPQTANLATSGNVAPSQFYNVVRRGDFLYLDNVAAQPTKIISNQHNPTLKIAHPMGMNLQSAETTRQSTGVQLQSTGKNLQSTGTNPQSTGTKPRSTGTKLQSTAIHLQSKGTNLQSTETLTLSSVGTNLQSSETIFQSTGTNLQSTEMTLSSAGTNLQSMETNLLSASNQPSDIPVAVPVSQSGSEALHLVLAPESDIEGSPDGKQIQTSSASPSGADDNQTDEGYQQVIV